VITDGGLAGVSAVGLATGPDGTAYSTAGFFDTVDGVDRRVVGAWTGSAWLPLTQNGYKTGSDFGHLLRVANDNTPYVMYLNDAFGFTVKRFVQE
jgi:hypothetical protein